MAGTGVSSGLGGGRYRGVLDLDSHAAIGRDGVRPRSGAEDRVVGELDPVGDACGIEDLDVLAGLGIVDHFGDLEAAGTHQLALLGPDRGGVVERVAVGSDLKDELEGGGPVA